MEIEQKSEGGETIFGKTGFNGLSVEGPGHGGRRKINQGRTVGAALAVQGLAERENVGINPFFRS